jgi:hypothetical protein
MLQLAELKILTNNEKSCIRHKFCFDRINNVSLNLDLPFPEKNIDETKICGNIKITLITVYDLNF